MTTYNNAIDAPLPISAANGGSGVASPTVHGVLLAEGSSAYTSLVLGAGQVLIGTTASDPSATTLTNGTGISISSASGSITINNTQTALSYVDQASSSVTMAVNTGYIIDNGASLVTATLPATAALGSTFQLVGFSSGGWKLGQAASQLINFGNVVTTTGTGGYLQFNNQYDSVTIVCTAANTKFTVTASIGNIIYN